MDEIKEFQSRGVLPLGAGRRGRGVRGENVAPPHLRAGSQAGRTAQMIFGPLRRQTRERTSTQVQMAPTPVTRCLPDSPPFPQSEIQHLPFFIIESQRETCTIISFVLNTFNI